MTQKKTQLVIWLSKEQINLSNSVIAAFVRARRASPGYRLPVYVDISFTLTLSSDSNQNQDKIREGFMSTFYVQN